MYIEIIHLLQILYVKAVLVCAFLGLLKPSPVSNRMSWAFFPLCPQWGLGFQVVSWKWLLSAYQWLGLYAGGLSYQHFLMFYCFISTSVFNNWSLTSVNCAV